MTRHFELAGRRLTATLAVLAALPLLYVGAYLALLQRTDPALGYTGRMRFAYYRVGGETAKVTCKGKGCPFKSKTYKNLKKGKKSLGSRFGLKRPAS